MEFPDFRIEMSASKLWLGIYETAGLIAFRAALDVRNPKACTRKSKP